MKIRYSLFNKLFVEVLGEKKIIVNYEIKSKEFKN